MGNAGEGIPMKLLIDKKRNKVLIAEAGREMVEFLSALISLPFSTILGNLSASSTGKLLQSLEKIDVFPADFARLKGFEKSAGRLISAYTISDDLIFTAFSTISVLPLLKKHRVDDPGDLEEKTVKVAITEESDHAPAEIVIKKDEPKITKMMPTKHGSYAVEWDDGSFTGIRGITLSYDSFISSIRFDYDLNGWMVHGETHGKTNGNHTTHVRFKMTLEFSHEFITGVSGHYDCQFDGCVYSIAFETNLKTLGPFGDARGTAFSFSTDVGATVGFHGFCSPLSSLAAIGIYLALQRPITLPRAAINYQRSM